MQNMTLAAALGQATESLSRLQADRFILLANNPDHDMPGALSGILGDGDWVVQYNRCLFHDALVPTRTKTIVFSYMRDNLGGAFGFDDQGRAEHDLQAYREARIVFLTSNRLMARGAGPRMDVPSVDIPFWLIDSVQLAGSLFADDQRSVPSCGFASICMLHLANTRRILRGTGASEDRSGRIYRCAEKWGVSGSRFSPGAAVDAAPAASWETTWLPSRSVEEGPDDPSAQTRLAAEFDDLGDVDRAQIVFKVARVFHQLGDMPRFRAMSRKALGTQFVERQGTTTLGIGGS